MVNRLLINGDQIRLIGFLGIADNDTVTINIYGPKKVVISNFVPRCDALLACHTIVTLQEYKYVDQVLVDKLIEAGVTSGTRFLRIRNTYLANIFD